MEIFFEKIKKTLNNCYELFLEVEKLNSITHSNGLFNVAKIHDYEEERNYVALLLISTLHDAQLDRKENEQDLMDYYHYMNIHYSEKFLCDIHHKDQWEKINIIAEKNLLNNTINHQSNNRKVKL
jgi:hypothetical protein